MFVIVHKETGKLVAMPGSEHSYTSAGKGDAMVFRTKENAQRHCCGNERIVRVADLFPAPRKW